MGYVKWAFRIVVLTLVAGFFHYTLPQHDIVRVTGTYEERIDFGNNSLFWSSAGSGNAASPVNRDVFFIQTKSPEDEVMVYRNEDTGWGWPPYFKFDTSNLQAEVGDMESTVEAPKWVVITHYGWRNELFSIYPNAVDVRPATGPDEQIIPWFNIVFLTFMAALFWGLYVRWRRFREARIDPVLEDIEDGYDAASDAIADRGSRVGRWVKGLRGK